MAEQIKLSGVPETIAVRETMMPESGQISQIGMSAMEDWGGEITEQNTPAARLLMHLPPARNISNKIAVLERV